MPNFKEAFAVGKVLSMGGGTLFGVNRFIAFATGKDDGLESSAGLGIAFLLVAATIYTNIITRYFRMTEMTEPAPTPEEEKRADELNANTLSDYDLELSIMDNHSLNNSTAIEKQHISALQKYGINPLIAVYAGFSFMSGVLSAFAYAEFFAKFSDSKMDDASWKYGLTMLMGGYLGTASALAFYKYNWTMLKNEYIPNALAGKWFKKEYEIDIINSCTDELKNYKKPTLILSSFQGEGRLALFQPEKPIQTLKLDQVPNLQNYLTANKINLNDLTPQDAKNIEEILKAYGRNQGYHRTVFIINGINTALGIALSSFSNDSTAAKLNNNFLSHIDKSLVLSENVITAFCALGVTSNFVISILMNLPANARLYKRTVELFQPTEKTEHTENYADVPKCNSLPIRIANELANFGNSASDAASVAISILTQISKLSGVDKHNPALLAAATFGAVFTLYNIFSLNHEGITKEKDRRRNKAQTNNNTTFSSKLINDTSNESLLAGSASHLAYGSLFAPTSAASLEQQKNARHEDALLTSDLIFGGMGPH